MLFAPAGRVLGEGERLVQPELADALERLAAEGAEPFYRGEPAERIAEWVRERGGLLTRSDLEAYRVIDRRPVRVALPRTGRSSPTRRRPPAGSSSPGRWPSSTGAPGRRGPRPSWR